jgi:adsorption protein B
VPAPHALYEHFVAALALLLLLNGLDDLVPTLLVVWSWALEKGRTIRIPEPEEERRIAIFVPCWREAAVIDEMVRRNLSAIRYGNFDVFLGAYPNDEATLGAGFRLAATLRRVHMAECPHAGPTSKADCLNWVYQRMLLFEEEHSVRFDTIVVHDAEDLIHPAALALINRERQIYDMIQVPVLALPTPACEVTHGVYCDDFAEYQTIDMRARQISRAFLPSNGVGTAYSRDVLDRLAETNSNRVFDPSCLTEDYESGVRIHILGYSQCFCVLDSAGDLTATREYFPRAFWSAVRQRTRWVMGIALQSWERNGWRGQLRTKYWFWRDRKGLWSNPLGAFANLLFLAGVLTWLWAWKADEPWTMRVYSPIAIWLTAGTLLLQLIRLAIRMECVRRIYGGPFALLVPLRLLHENAINGLATVWAVVSYTHARLRHRPLVWLKTEHAYPNREAFTAPPRDLEDILVGSGYVAESAVEELRAILAPGADLSDYLLAHSLIDEESLCEAISLKEGLPSVCLQPHDIDARVARSLPAKVGADLQMVPFRVEKGRLLVAGPKPPGLNFRQELSRFTRLEIEFHLVTWRNFEELKSVLL